MKSRWPFVAALTATAVLFFYNLGPITAQEVRSGGVTTLVTNQTLTSTYSYTNATDFPYLDLQSYDSVSIVIVPGTLFPNTMAKVKAQWSQDLVTWSDEPVVTAGTSSGTEQPYTALTRVLQLPLVSPTQPVPERYARLARYFRMGIASTNVTTSATLSVTAVPENNTTGK